MSTALSEPTHDDTPGLYEQQIAAEDKVFNARALAAVSLVIVVAAGITSLTNDNTDQHGISANLKKIKPDFAFAGQVMVTGKDCPFLSPKPGHPVRLVGLGKDQQVLSINGPKAAYDLGAYPKIVIQPCIFDQFNKLVPTGETPLLLSFDEAQAIAKTATLHIQEELARTALAHGLTEMTVEIGRDVPSPD